MSVRGGAAGTRPGAAGVRAFAASWAGSVVLHAVVIAVAASTVFAVRAARRAEFTGPIAVGMGGEAAAGLPAAGREPVGAARPEVPAATSHELELFDMPAVPQSEEIVFADGAAGGEEPGPAAADDPLAGRLPSPSGRGRVADRPGRRGPALAWDPMGGGGSGGGADGAARGVEGAGPGDGSGDGGTRGVGRRAGGRAPRYPRVAREEGWEGTVSLDLRVTAEGAVAEARVATSSGHECLDDAALEAARSWAFEPALAEGRPTEGRVRIPVTFRLTE